MRPEGAGSRDVHRWLRRAAGAVSRRYRARVDIDAGRRLGGATLPGAVESSESARRAGQRSTQESGKAMKKMLLAAAMTTLVCVTTTADVGELRRFVTTLASERFGGRLTGTEGERLAREFLVTELKRIGARPLPGQ